MFSDRELEPVYAPRISRKEILSEISSFYGLVVRSKTPIDEEVINAASNLKFVARAGAGIEKMDTDLLQARGIKWVNAPEGNRDAVGEHTIGMLLSLLHNLNHADGQVREKIWDREGNRGYELKGRTVGIFGYGNMGSALAEKLQGFGCNVIAYDKYKKGYGSESVKECDLDTFIANTEILSIHVPLTDETRSLFNVSFSERFNKLFIVLNTARGEILTNKTIIHLLQTGRVMGACLDVLEHEKLNKMSAEEEREFQFLVDSPNVILSPHVAGWTHESYRRINEVLISKLEHLALI